MLRLCRAKLPLVMFTLLVVVHDSEAAELAVLRAAANTITSDELRSHVAVLADDSFEGREAGSRGGYAAAGYLVRQLQSRSLQPAGENGSYFQSFGQGFRNVLALLEGSDPELKQDVILVGAHYDHVGYGSQTNSYGPWGYIHNGADDNASGISGLLEVIDAMLAAQPAPRRSLLFAFFDGEEKGLLGSKHWLTDPTLPLRRVAFMMNVDMIGRMQNQRVEVYGTRSATSLRRFVCETNALTGLQLDFTWEMKENSDHYPFFARRIPTLMLHTGLHGDYHRPSDDVERLNVDGIQHASRLLFAMAYELATRNTLFTFRDDSYQEHPGHKEGLELPIAHAPPRLGASWKQATADPQVLIVDDVTQGSPAQRGGLLVGDRLLKFAGRPITDPSTLRMEILAATPPVEILVERSGQPEPLALKIELAGSPSRIGITWREDQAEPGTVLLTQVIYGSAAHQAGLVVRDRIYSVGGRSFQGSIELHKLLTTSPSPIDVEIERDGRMRSVSLRPME